MHDESGFFFHLAQGGFFGRFAGFDVALWKAPCDCSVLVLLGESNQPVISMVRKLAQNDCSCAFHFSHDVAVSSVMSNNGSFPISM